MRANGDEDRVEFSGCLFFQYIVDAMIQRDFHTQVLDALYLGLQFIARHSVRRNTKMDHATRNRARFANFDGMSQANQLIGRRQTAGSCPDDEYSLRGLL